MRIVAILRDARGERRPYAEALAALSRRGHDVTLLVPRGAPFDALPVARIEVSPPALPLGADGKEPPAATGIIHDLDERFRVGRAMLPHCEAADVLLIDASSCLGAVAAHLEGPRKVCLLLDAPEVASAAREPNLHDDDLARLLSIAAVTEYTERRCGLTIVPSENDDELNRRDSEVRKTAGADASTQIPTFRRSAIPSVSSTRERWARVRPSRPERTRVIEPAADLDAAAKAEHAQDLMESGRPIIASLTPPTHGAGFEALVRAFREIRTEASRATLVIGGSDPHFFPARRAFRDVVVDRVAPDLADAIVFRPDDGPAGALALLASADVAVSFTQDAGASGHDIVLALAAGAPLVAADHPRRRSWLAGREAAVLVPPSDPTAIARAVVDLWQDRPRALSQAARGKILARERFGLPRLSDELERALTQTPVGPPP